MTKRAPSFDGASAEYFSLTKRPHHTRTPRRDRRETERERFRAGPRRRARTYNAGAPRNARWRPRERDARTCSSIHASGARTPTSDRIKRLPCFRQRARACGAADASDGRTIARTRGRHRRHSTDEDGIFLRDAATRRRRESVEARTSAPSRRIFTHANVLHLPQAARRRVAPIRTARKPLAATTATVVNRSGTLPSRRRRRERDRDGARACAPRSCFSSALRDGRRLAARRSRARKSRRRRSPARRPAAIEGGSGKATGARGDPRRRRARARALEPAWRRRCVDLQRRPPPHAGSQGAAAPLRPGDYAPARVCCLRSRTDRRISTICFDRRRRAVHGSTARFARPTRRPGASSARYCPQACAFEACSLRRASSSRGRRAPSRRGCAARCGAKASRCICCSSSSRELSARRRVPRAPRSARAARSGRSGARRRGSTRRARGACRRRRRLAGRRRDAPVGSGVGEVVYRGCRCPRVTFASRL